MKSPSPTRTTRIVIDGNEANVGQRVGSNVYAFQLLKAIYELTRRRSDIEITVVLATGPVGDLPSERHGWRYEVFGPSTLWTQWALPWYLWHHRHTIDVFFTPGHYAPRITPVPYVSSVMDVAYRHFPSQFKHTDRIQLSQWTKYSVGKAAKVVTISQFSKQEIVKEYHRQPSDIVVAHPALDVPAEIPPAAQQKQTLKQLGIRVPYLLYVGTLQPRKNVERLIAAFEQVDRWVTDEPQQITWPAEAKKAAQPKLQLVLAGKVGWLAEGIQERIAASPIKDQIVVTGYIDELTKHILLKNAATCVLVGLYEGFGIPPLEALHWGTIPVVANSSSLPEVVGRAGIKVDPLQELDIATGIWKVLTLTPRQKQLLRRAGQRQVNQFSWQASAERVLTTLLEVARATR